GYRNGQPLIIHIRVPLSIEGLAGIGRSHVQSFCSPGVSRCFARDRSTLCSWRWLLCRLRRPRRKAAPTRTVYQQSTFTDGTTASNADRDYDRYFGALRAGYELTPRVKPFIETGVDRRVHDLAIDRSGVRRDSDGRYVK